MTAPLSYTGESCADFRPDFRTEFSIQKTTHRININQKRATQSIPTPAIQFISYVASPSYFSHIISTCSTSLLPVHGRAPPAESDHNDIVLY